MKDRTRLPEQIKEHLLYGGIKKEDYDQVQKPIAEANHKALTHWSILVSFFGSIVF